jgi:hypothetical protein
MFFSSLLLLSSDLYTSSFILAIVSCSFETMFSDKDNMCSIDFLPEEMLIEIFRYLPTSSLLCGVAQTCWSWRSIVRRESEFGFLVNDILIDGNQLGEDNSEFGVSEILTLNSPLHCIEMRNLSKSVARSVLESVKTNSEKVKKLSFACCDCSNISIRSLNKIESLSFGLDCNVPIRVLEEISVSFPNLNELKFPNIPSAFIPLILHSHPRIQGSCQGGNDREIKFQEIEIVIFLYLWLIKLAKLFRRSKRS